VVGQLPVDTCLGLLDPHESTSDVTPVAGLLKVEANLAFEAATRVVEEPVLVVPLVPNLEQFALFAPRKPHGIAGASVRGTILARDHLVEMGVRALDGLE